jgi:hypothetical protein
VKVEINRSTPVDGYTTAEFSFDGVSAGKLTIEWKAWQLWLKLIMAGVQVRNRDGVPVEVEVHGYQAELPIETPVASPEPTPQSRPAKPSFKPAAKPLPKELDPSDDAADAILGNPPGVK